MVLERLLDACTFVYASAWEGEVLHLLSHHLTEEEVVRATRHPPVQRAVRALAKRVVFAEWYHVGYEGPCFWVARPEQGDEPGHPLRPPARTEVYWGGAPARPADAPDR